MIYNSNFDASGFQSSREFNRTIDDPCATQQREQDNNKKLKFVTTNFRDLVDAKDQLNFYGMTIKDKLFVPAESMDQDSQLKYGETGGILTNCKTKQGFGQLPLPTMPSRYQMYHGDVEIEDSMRNLSDNTKNACDSRDTEYYKRHFYLFNDLKGIETPDATKSIETPDFGPRGGLSTRFIVRPSKNEFKKF
jgi:hypothetical protein